LIYHAVGTGSQSFSGISKVRNGMYHNTIHDNIIGPSPYQQQMSMAGEAPRASILPPAPQPAQLCRSHAQQHRGFAGSARIQYAAAACCARQCRQSQAQSRSALQPAPQFQGQCPFRSTPAGCLLGAACIFKHTQTTR
jgi:hypothetical protein